MLKCTINAKKDRLYLPVILQDHPIIWTLNSETVCTQNMRTAHSKPRTEHSSRHHPAKNNKSSYDLEIISWTAHPQITTIYDSVACYSDSTICKLLFVLRLITKPREKCQSCLKSLFFFTQISFDPHQIPGVFTKVKDLVLHVKLTLTKFFYQLLKR